MSLDMTMGTREAALGDADEAEVAAAPVERLWLKDLMVVFAATLGVATSSALDVLLFLR